MEDATKWWLCQRMGDGIWKMEDGRWNMGDGGFHKVVAMPEDGI